MTLYKQIARWLNNQDAYHYPLLTRNKLATVLRPQLTVYGLVLSESRPQSHFDLG
jgi:hypothetical protein